MQDDRFDIVFQKLEEVQQEWESGTATITVELDRAENEAIDELRRLSLELAEPLVTFHTGT